jgi:hypothetical protein
MEAMRVDERPGHPRLVCRESERSEGRIWNSQRRLPEALLCTRPEPETASSVDQ